MKLPVYIPVFNQLSETIECVESLRRNSNGPIEIIVVDDGSTDGSAAWCCSQVDVNIIQLEHGGFTAAANEIFQRGSEKNTPFVMLNNDTIPKPGWDTELLRELSKSPSTGVVSSLILEHDDSDYAQQAGYNHPFSKSGRPIPLAALEHKGPLKSYFLPTHKDQPWLSFTALAFKPECVASVGQLTPVLRNYFSDTDFGLRAVEQGWKLRIAVGSVVAHKGQRTTGLNGRRLSSEFLNERRHFCNRWSERVAVNSKSTNDFTSQATLSADSSHQVAVPMVGNRQFILEDLSLAEISARLSSRQCQDQLLFISPHPDDAALSAGAFLAHACWSHDIQHLVVFSKSRYSKGKQIHSEEAVTARRAAEEVVYNSLLGIRPRLLGFPDLFLRNGACPNVEVELAILNMLRSTQCQRVFAPLAAGAHPDHECVLNATLRAFSRYRSERAGANARLILYEDLPYSIAEHAVENARRKLSIRNLNTSPMTFELLPYADTKIRRIGIYASQLDHRDAASILSYGFAIGETIFPGTGAFCERFWLVGDEDDTDSGHSYCFI